ncbi:unnamed protein product [Haemonchus placei]|uniref:Golgin-84 n=1 Tax=Haemonchus placei TaxID=6290 RepID=A0A0N4WMF2_HAEPC|nr:unnamed protein product [Haemonchus placei]
MSVSAGGEETLTSHNYQDDSLCTDEFEIISCDTLSHGAHETRDDTLSQWNTKHSINVESTIPMNNLTHILCSTHSEVPSLTSGSSFKSVPESLPGEANKPSGGQVNPIDNRGETAILVGTVGSVKSSVADSTLVDAPCMESYSTLDSVIRSQSETREMLEKAIMSLDSMNKERTEFASKFETINNLEQEISSLKTRVAELEQENQVLKQQNMKAEQVSICEQKSKESESDDDKLASLKEKLSMMEKQLYDRGLEVDSRTKALQDATAEIEAAHRKIADLTESNKTTASNCKELSHKLDETFALLVAERERVSIAEDEIRSLRAAGGEGFSFPMTNEQMVAREMREKAVYAQKLERELEETRKRLDELTKCVVGKDDELRTHMEIINVLKEEDGEGRREIAERDRRIKELEEMVEGMFLDRAERTSVTHSWPVIGQFRLGLVVQHLFYDVLYPILRMSIGVCEAIFLVLYRLILD